jgi:branched-subunit amino acid transport protein
MGHEATRVRFWLIIIAAGIVTYSTRASFIVLGDRVSLPPIVQRSLRYVAPAAFAAIAVPLILGRDGLAGFDEDLPRILAATAAGAVVWKSRNIPLSLAVGMTTLWLLTWLT